MHPLAYWMLREGHSGTARITPPPTEEADLVCGACGALIARQGDWSSQEHPSRKGSVVVVGREALGTTLLPEDAADAWRGEWRQTDCGLRCSCCHSLIGRKMEDWSVRPKDAVFGVLPSIQGLLLSDFCDKDEASRA